MTPSSQSVTSSFVTGSPGLNMSIKKTGCGRRESQAVGSYFRAGFFSLPFFFRWFGFHLEAACEVYGEIQKKISHFLDAQTSGPITRERGNRERVILSLADHIHQRTLVSKPGKHDFQDAGKCLRGRKDVKEITENHRDPTSSPVAPGIIGCQGYYHYILSQPPRRSTPPPKVRPQLGLPRKPR